MTDVGDDRCWLHVCDDSATNILKRSPSWSHKHHCSQLFYNKECLMMTRIWCWCQNLYFGNKRSEWNSISYIRGLFIRIFCPQHKLWSPSSGIKPFKMAQHRNVFAEEDYKFQHEVPTSLNFNHFNFISLLILIGLTNLLTFYWMCTAWSKLIMINVLLSKS